MNDLINYRLTFRCFSHEIQMKTHFDVIIANRYGIVFDFHSIWWMGQRTNVPIWTFGLEKQFTDIQFQPTGVPVIDLRSIVTERKRNRCRTDELGNVGRIQIVIHWRIGKSTNVTINKNGHAMENTG